MSFFKHISCFLSSLHLRGCQFKMEMRWASKVSRNKTASCLQYIRKNAYHTTVWKVWKFSFCLSLLSCPQKSKPQRVFARTSPAATLPRSTLPCDKINISRYEDDALQSTWVTIWEIRQLDRGVPVPPALQWRPSGSTGVAAGGACPTLVPREELVRGRINTPEIF